MTSDSELRRGKMYKIAKFDQYLTGRFPFDCPFGIYVEETLGGFHRFVWDGKELLMNKTEYEFEEVKFIPESHLSSGVGGGAVKVGMKYFCDKCGHDVTHIKLDQLVEKIRES